MFIRHNSRSVGSGHVFGLPSLRAWLLARREHQAEAAAAAMISRLDSRQLHDIGQDDLRPAPGDVRPEAAPEAQAFHMQCLRLP